MKPKNITFNKNVTFNGEVTFNKQAQFKKSALFNGDVTFKRNAYMVNIVQKTLYSFNNIPIKNKWHLLKLLLSKKLNSKESQSCQLINFDNNCTCDIKDSWINLDFNQFMEYLKESALKQKATITHLDDRISIHNNQNKSIKIP